MLPFLSSCRELQPDAVTNASKKGAVGRMKSSLQYVPKQEV